MEYPKTENLWVRDPETHLMAPQNGFRLESFSQVDSWLVLEKIDGMNMRVIWEPYPLAEEYVESCKVPRIAGRTDRAQIPGDLLDYMKSKFTYETMMAAFSYYKELDDGTTGHFRPERVVLFGEGYGPGIQQGGHYREDKSFTLFDVVIDGRWQRWSEVERVAEVLGVNTPMVLGQRMSTFNVQNLVSLMCNEANLGEWLCETDTPEGIIARTDPYLFDSNGRLVKFKHKVRDVVKYLETVVESLPSEDNLAGSA